MASSDGALAKLYLEHKGKLFTLAVAIVGDRGLAEDVLHDVFAGILRKPGPVLASKSPRKYLAVSVRNRAFTLIRDRRSLNSRLRAKAELPVPENVGPVETLERSDEKAKVMGLLSELPDELRDVLAMRIWGNLGFREIAKVTGTSRTTVYARYWKALDVLRGGLAKE
ncbi:MAG: RNA polymerase sigma factor [Planctomycetota bacterium]